MPIPDNAKITKTIRGYLQAIWTDPENGTLHREYIHRLVWIDAHGPIPLGHHIHHVDGDKTNNAIDNLELKSENQHAKDHGWKRWRRK